MATTSSSKRQLVHTSNTYQSNSDLTVGGDLFVNGATTTIDTANLLVEDKNIIIGNVSSPSDTTADGGGITLKGATDYTINWTDSTNQWYFNQGVNITGQLDVSTHLNVGGYGTLAGLDINGNSQFDGAVTVGVNDTGHDVIFYGATAARYLKWNQAEDKLNLRDNVQVTFGNSNDLEIRHDSSNNNNYIQSNNGRNLFIEANGISLRSQAGENMITATGDGAVQLYHNNALKLTTTAGGADVSGTFGTTTINLDGELNFTTNGSKFIDVNTLANSNTFNIRHHNPSGNLYELAFHSAANGATTLYYDGSAKFATTTDGIQLHGNGYIDLPDNGRARFGQSQDLAIYHTTTGNHSYIDNITGDLFIRNNSNDCVIIGHNANKGLIYCPDGRVELRFNDVKKFETTSGGASFSGGLYISGNYTDAGDQLNIWCDSNGHGNVAVYDFTLKTGSNNSRTNTFKIDNNGKVGIGTASPDTPLEIEVPSAANTQTRCFHIDHNPTSNTGSGYLTIRSGTNAVSSASLEQVSSGGGSFYGTYSDTNLINHGTQTSGAWNNINFVTNEAIRMTVGGGSQAGNVGIGTTSPSALLHVKDSSAGAGVVLKIENNGASGAAQIDLKNDVQSWFVNTRTDDHFSIYNNTSASTPFLIKTDGNVGIGVTDPDHKLHVHGTIAIKGGELADTARIHFQASDESNRFTLESDFNSSTTTDLLGFRSTTADNILVLKGDGKVGIGTTSPAAKLDILGDNNSLAFNIIQGGETAFRFSTYIEPTTTYTPVFRQGLYYNSTENATIGYCRGGSSVGGFLTFQTNGAEKMRLDANGRLGIGTTNPQRKLDVRGTAGIQYAPTAHDTQGSIVLIADGSNNSYIELKDGSSTIGVKLNTSGDSYLNGGNVGIGITGPSKKLHIDGDIKVKNSGKLFLWNDNDDNYLDYQNWIASTGNAQLIRNTGAGGIKLKSTSLEVVVTSGVGIGTTSPSHTLHVYDSAGPTIKFERSSSSNLEFQFGTTNASIIGAGEIQFRANGGSTNKFIINNSQIQSNAKFLVNTNSGIDVHTSDTGTIIQSGNSSATSTPDQFFINHSLGNVDMGNNRGNIKITKGILNPMFSDTTSGLSTEAMRWSYYNASSSYYLSLATEVPAGGVVRYHWNMKNNGTAYDDVMVFDRGNVGIGTDPDPSVQLDVGSVFKFNTSTDLLTITNNQNTGGIKLSGGNSRIYFGNYRAIEGDQSGGTLYLGEGYGTISLMDDTIVTGNVGIGTTSPATSLQVSKLDATSAITIHRDGSNPSTNTSLGKIIFAQDYNGTQQNAWGQIDLKTNASSVRTDMAFKVKSTSGNEMTAMTLHGTTSDGPRVGIGTTTPAEKLQVDGYVRTKNSKYKKYTSLTGSSNDWFPIYQVNDHKGGQVTFTVNTYAHSSCTFVVSEGYGPSGQSGNPAHINVLNYLYHPNGGYANITGVRVNQIGMVEIKLTFTSGPSVSIGVRVESSEELQSSLASSLATSTSSEAIRDTVSLSNKYARFKRLTLGDDGEVSLPALNFGSSGSTGLYYDSANSALRVSVAGTQRAYFSSAGILSTGSVYSGTSGQFRNYGGTWQATTGTGTNGFTFKNTNEAQTAATITSKGTLTLNGGTTSTKLYLYETYTDASNYERTTFEYSSGYLNIDANKAGSGTTSGIKLGANGYTFLQLEPEGNVLINGADDNGNKADFSVGVGTTPRVSWHGQQVQIGGMDMNYNGNISHTGSIFQMVSWSSNIEFMCNSSSGGDNRDIYFKPFNGTAPSEAMRIKGDGKVGIGTSSPQTPLHVEFSGTDGLRLRSTDNDCYLYLSNNTANRNNIIYFGDNSSSFSGMIQYNHQYDYMAFRVNGGEKVRISSSGQLGVGTNAPAHKLDVVGTYRISDNTTNANNKLHRMLGRHYTNAEQDVNIFSSISTSSTNVVSFGGGSSSYNTATHILFYTASNNTSTYAVGQERFRIHNNGNIGIAIGSPEQKLHVDGAIRSKVYTVNTLPAANSTAVGTRAFVSDSLMSASGNFGATIAGYGSGSYTVPVWCDGAYWYIG